METRKCENGRSEVFTIKNVQECKEKESAGVVKEMKKLEVWTHGFLDNFLCFFVFFKKSPIFFIPRLPLSPLNVC